MHIRGTYSPPRCAQNRVRQEGKKALQNVGPPHTGLSHFAQSTAHKLANFGEVRPVDRSGRETSKFQPPPDLATSSLWQRGSGPEVSLVRGCLVGHAACLEHSPRWGHV